MEEIWKDIKGYEGLYQASNLGHIRSIGYRQSSRVKNKDYYILSPGRDTSGYLNCVLFKNKIRKSYKVHRLIAQTFIDNPFNYTDVNHKNEIKDDNRIENLEWVTHKYNMNYGTFRERMKEKTRSINKHVIQFDLSGNMIKEWTSIREAAINNNISVGNIINCCKGRCKTCGGYIWKYNIQCVDKVS